MRKFVMLFFLVPPFLCYSQSKKDLQTDVKVMQVQIQMLESTVNDLKIKMELLEKDIAYCKGQQSISPNSTNQNYQQPALNASNQQDTTQKKGSTPKTGATIYTGPRGGQYYINKNGHKTYIKH